VPLLCVTTPGATIEKPVFAERFKGIGPQSEQNRILERVHPIETSVALLTAHNLVEVARKRAQDLAIVYMYATAQGVDAELLFEIAFRPTPAGTLACKVSVRARPDKFAALAADAAAILLSM